MADNEWAKFRKEQFQKLKDDGIDFKGQGCKLKFIAKLWAEYKVNKQAKQDDEFDEDDIDDIEDDDEDIENIEDILVKVAQDIVNANVLKAKENMRKEKQKIYYLVW